MYALENLTCDACSGHWWETGAGDGGNYPDRTYEQVVSATADAGCPIYKFLLFSEREALEPLGEDIENSGLLYA